MKYFDTYVSNTLAGGGSQTVFYPEDRPFTGRIFYRITEGGRFNYSLLFSNIVDSTFSDGSVSHKNLVIDSWTIHSARLGICKKLDFDAMCAETKEPCITMSETEEPRPDHIAVSGFVPLTFEGKESKEVAPGEFFATDPVSLCFESGEYLCFEITFQGKMLPFHAESILPAFVSQGDCWQYSRLIPFPAMIGVDRKVAKKVAYIGDSITQGCGTPINGYAHWNAVLSQKLPRENAYWNLGYGYARASDAASNGAWLFKAKQNDYVAVCFGVNDIFHEYASEGANSARNIKRSLNDIVDFLHASNVKVLVQTVPPFDYPDHLTEIWREVNAFIRNELIHKAEAVFDCVPVLSTGGPDCPTAAYCGHPNVEGSAKWAEALLPAMESFLAL